MDDLDKLKKTAEEHLVLDAWVSIKPSRLLSLIARVRAAEATARVAVRTKDEFDVMQRAREWCSLGVPAERLFADYNAMKARAEKAETALAPLWTKNSSG